MSNIVERLRHWAAPDKAGLREGRADDFAEAADLIDRLHELKTPATRQLLNITKAALENAEAEIAGLQTVIKDQRTQLNRLGDRFDAQSDEIEQLRAALANVYGELLGAPGEAAETVRAMIRNNRRKFFGEQWEPNPPPSSVNMWDE